MKSSVLIPVILATQLAFLGCVTPEPNGSDSTGPDLVLLISLDQFRWSYFERFEPFFGDNGFRRFISEGAVLPNVRYRHAATMTCPGHAVISTGSSGDVNGIVANGWYDINRHRNVYCAEDSTVALLGRPGPGRSPRNLVAKTIGDILKERTPLSKVYSVAGKDRSAIMMGGHAADGAYWLWDSVMTTSTYYVDELPEWVDGFNGLRLPQQVHGRTWNRVLPPEVYEATQGPDDYWNEEDRQGLGKTFPHPITGGSDQLDRNFYEALRKSPFEDEILLQFVRQLIDEEQVGFGGPTDILALGLSTVDRVGHPYGPDSHEIMDIVIRTDRILADLFSFLDERIGMDHVLVVLTADHGVQRLPELVADPEHNVWAGRVSSASIREDVTSILDAAFGRPTEPLSWIERLNYPHLHLSREALADRDIELPEAVAEISTNLPMLRQYDAAIPYTAMEANETPERYSWFAGRSGDVLVRLAEHHIGRGTEFGTTHGTPWDGDQHVPMLWLGSSIPNGVLDQEVNVIDLAPTLAALLKLERPETMVGSVISGLAETSGD